jgi:hypothetical protein
MRNWTVSYRILVATFLVSVLFSAMGITMGAASVHGPEGATLLFKIFLLPIFALSQLRVHVPVPFFDRTSTFGVLLFLLLQFLYYWGVICLIQAVARRFRHRPRMARP